MIMFATVSELFEAMVAWRDNDLIAGLLMAIFLVTLAIGIMCLLFLLTTIRHRQLGPSTSRAPQRVAAPRAWNPRLVTPCRWLSIQSSEPIRVQEALQLHKTTPCSWLEALTFSQDQQLFITPPVNGWILVLGSGLPSPSYDVDKCYVLLLELSRKLGEIQFFSANRISNHHAWAQARDGRIVRAYAWNGQTIWNEGAMTRAEADLHLTCFDYAEAPQSFEDAMNNPVVINTQRVSRLASRWSIDPSSIDPYTLRERHGIAGKLSWRKTV